MKRMRFLLPLLFVYAASFVAADAGSLVAELESDYASRFYPGVIRSAERILRTERNSLLQFRAAVYGGESLFRTGQTEKAAELLRKYSYNGNDRDSLFLNSARQYWLGRCFYRRGMLLDARACFYSGAVFYQQYTEVADDRALQPDYHAASVLYSGKCCFELAEYENAASLFAFVVANGNLFSAEEFAECAVRLAVCYNSLGRFSECDSFVSRLEAEQFARRNDIFSADDIFTLRVLHADSLSGLSEYKRAYNLYCSVVADAPPPIAVHALKKACTVSFENKDVVGTMPISVIAQNEEAFSAFPGILAEIWTARAVDAFNEEDYGTATECFSRAERAASDYQKLVAAVYRAEILWRTSSDKRSGARAAAEVLSAAESTAKGKKNASVPILDSVRINLARFYGYAGDWQNCRAAAELCVRSSDAEIRRVAVYWAALSRYETGAAKSAVAVIEAYKKEYSDEEYSSADAPVQILYAKSLAKCGEYQKADELFSRLGEKNLLDDDGLLDYSRTALILGQYNETKTLAAEVSGVEAVYLAALASFNQRNWSEAERGFSKIMNSGTRSETLAEPYSVYAVFYDGYCLYQLGDFSAAVSVLSRFISENPRHAFVWSAYMMSARSSASVKQYDAASYAAEMAVKTSSGETELHEAVLLCAGIYSDSGRFDDALALLSPYMRRKNAFGYECLYKSAEICVQKGDRATADSYFAVLAASSAKDAAVFAEDAAYRRGELYYSLGEYARAADLFEEYCRKWPNGTFFFGAVYFSADSLARSGETDIAVLRYLQIVDSDAKTSYRYNARKNLVDLYEKRGEYQNALFHAEHLISEYGTQAVNDGMKEKISEIRRASAEKKSDTDARIARAEKELAEQRNDAARSAEALENALFLAAAYRNAGEGSKSAFLYLDAALFARRAGNDAKAARSLYGAVEAFDAAGLFADSKETFAELQKLYPESSYTAEGKKIVGEQ